MIPTGMNGRTEGTFLVHELLAAKKISIPKDDLLYADGHHKLLGVEFSDEIREDPALSAVLQEITEDLIRLFYEAEKDERLFVPKERIGGTLRQYVRNEDLTGMTLLNLFADRFITLCERDDGTWEWKAIPLVMRELPDAQKIIGAVLEDILGFSGRVGTSAAFSVARRRDLPVSTVTPASAPRDFAALAAARPSAVPWRMRSCRPAAPSIG